MTDQDPSAIIIPFGKHRGSTVAELLAKDPAYAEWLAAQGWLAQRFAELHAAILARGAGADDSPEHNRIQVRFLDPLFRAAVISLTQNVQEARIRDWNERARDLKESLRKLPAVIDSKEESLKYNQKMLANPIGSAGVPPGYRQRQISEIEQELPSLRTQLADTQTKFATFPHLPLLSSVAFEQHGVDARILWAFLETLPDVRSGHNPLTFNIEIKPSLGDDYPTVMRQIQRLQCSILLIETYSGTVPLPVLQQMFAANSTQLLTLQDVEAEIPNARQLLENPQP